LNGFDAAVDGGQSVVDEVRDKLLEPFIAATRAALGEMAGADLVVRAVYRKPMQRALGDIAAVIGLRPVSMESPPSYPSTPLAGERCRGERAMLLLSFPRRTAAALAGRILAGVATEVDENLIRDCVGEIANVVAGQAKALLAERPVRFGFSLPQVVVNADEFHPPPGLDCLVVAFTCDRGEFALQLFVEL
jgi:chemotaxis protein CheX